MKLIANLSKVVILLFLIFILVSCGDPTATPKGSLSGYVVLDGDEITDYSGIIVELYNITKLDTTLVRINRDYPQIGVMISQETEFDHRLDNPLSSAITDANGSFGFKEISVGQYNLVLKKEGWGFIYKLDISLGEGDNIVADMNDPLKMYPEVIVESHISGEMILEPGRHYIFEENTIFHPDSHLIIQPGAILRINQDKSITILGNLTTESLPGKFFKVTSNDGFISGASSIANYSNVTIESSAIITDNTVSGGIFSYGNYGIILLRNGTTIENIKFNNELAGCHIMSRNNINIHNVLFSGSQDQNNASFFAVFMDESVVSNSIFLNNLVGVRIQSSTQNVISNNYFVNNQAISVLHWFNSDNLIKENIFTHTDEAIINSGASSINIQKNIIIANIGVNNRDLQGAGGFAHPTINYNNFECSQFAVRTRYFSSASIRYHDATQNYWGTTIASEIEALIWDRNDELETDPYYDQLKAYFNYTPYLNQKYPGAGIQTERNRSK